MQDTAGTIIDADGGTGNPATDTDIKSGHRTESAGSGAGSGGSGYEEPRTAFIGGDDGIFSEPTGSGESGGFYNVKRTKSGAIDKRSIRGNRARKDGAGTSPETVGLSSLSLEDVIFNLHQLAAVIVAPLTNIPAETLALDHKEAKQLSDAVKEVGKYYNAVFDPKKVAIFNLSVTAGGIYGMRLWAIWNTRKAAPRPVAVPKSTPINIPPRSQQSTQQNQPATGPLSPSDVFGDQTGTL